MDVIRSQKIGSYDQEVVFPPVGSVGVTQFDHQHDKESYFQKIESSMELQNRFKSEAGIDIVSRVAAMLHEKSGLRVRIAREGTRDYFAGLLRAVDNAIQIHPDYAPYDGPDWEIGRISAQLTWNILLKQVPGGDTIIYDRQWQGRADDVVFRKKFPRYAYDPVGLQGNVFKCLMAKQGDLTLFNPRNFHEVKPCDRSLSEPGDVTRFTMSSFVGLLGSETGGDPELILWS
ncbi:hypothetical protein BLS_009702 [Venturia inaequalis]|uniref:Prolyl 4-hydroxylase alpha subunit Fe(2+) 2OG dioxygenase domain-containing protein n=1 Tax=Venturia inaequalis TaxID=5025 RepID=A0A8H3YLY4_VENIN|nr:hypothetical protein BLS_009702 [Venturia inaequalis]